MEGGENMNAFALDGKEQLVYQKPVVQLSDVSEVESNDFFVQIIIVGGLIAYFGYAIWCVRRGCSFAGVAKIWSGYISIKCSC